MGQSLLQNGLFQRGKVKPLDGDRQIARAAGDRIGLVDAVEDEEVAAGAGVDAKIPVAVGGVDSGWGRNDTLSASRSRSAPGGSELSTDRIVHFSANDLTAVFLRPNPLLRYEDFEPVSFDDIAAELDSA
ncbi:hypothetical protein BTE77_34955 [Ensifer adhaerens]|nr:hypothetical protein BTE77_34955 [Ensifer adhaerens]